MLSSGDMRAGFALLHMQKLDTRVQLVHIVTKHPLPSLLLHCKTTLTLLTLAPDFHK